MALRAKTLKANVLPGDGMKRYAMAILSMAFIAGCASPPNPKTSLQPGDVVSVDFRGIPTPETHTSTINPGGNITLPYVGNVGASGKTPAELEVEIKKAFLEPSGWIKSFDVNVSRVDRQ